MKNYGSPTVRRRIVAAELRRLRTERGVRQQEAADVVGLTRNAMSRYEHAESSMQPGTARQLFAFLGLDGHDLDLICDLVQGSRTRGWLKELRDVVPGWFSEYVCLEQDASHIKEFSLAAIPGYLQTTDYAREILLRGSDTFDIEENVKVRVARGEFLRTDAAGEYHVVLKETALRTRVGGQSIMNHQLDWIQEQAKRSNVTLQVLPEDHGAHPSMTSSFITLRFSDFPYFGVAYVDYLTGSLYRDEPDEVARYEEAFANLARLALSPAQSQRLVHSILKGQNS